MEQTIMVLKRLKAKLESSADNCAALAIETVGIEGIRFDGRRQGFKSAILAVEDEIRLLQEG